MVLPMAGFEACVCCKARDVFVLIGLPRGDSGGEFGVEGLADEEGVELLGSTAQMRAVWSALQVARWRTSGERRTRVM